MLSKYSLPAQVLSMSFLENGKIQESDSNWEEFKHLFLWVNKNDIQQRILRLKKIT